MLRSLPDNISEELELRGLFVRHPTEADKCSLFRAEKIILQVSDLWAVVTSTVAGIAPLSNVEDAFDVSHSEPWLENTILLSFPPRGPLTGLRLAEGVVHEAMHICLSKYEEFMPLVKSLDLMFSPWRSAPRETGGVLHGLYVFSCVGQFIQQLLAIGELSIIERKHACGRLREIDRDIAKINDEQLVGNLTTEGRALANALLNINKRRLRAEKNLELRGVSH